MNPLNFYTHPDLLDYEKDVDPIGRDLIKHINQTDYLKTTMYCSGHFKDEQEYPWMIEQMELCLVVINQNIVKASNKLEECSNKVKSLGWKIHGRGFCPYVYIDKDNNEIFYIVDIHIDYMTKKDRENIIKILTTILQ
jgi:hypothetical protein